LAGGKCIPERQAEALERADVDEIAWVSRWPR
jgi:hypothetical protein